MKKVKGAKEFKMLSNGCKLTRKGAMLAKCYECMGYYKDGVEDCQMPTCPLYAYNPYGHGSDMAIKPKGNAGSLIQD